MSRIDPARPFVPLPIAIVSVSDTRTLETDSSGLLLAELLTAAGHRLAGRTVVRDEIALIRSTVQALIADPEIPVVITTGGTGLTGRDVTIEAVRPLFEKEIEGFSPVFHQISLQSVGTSTLQSRATAGLANATLVFCLPGSRGAVRDGWEGILVHQLDARHRPCNLVELMPRFTER